MASVAPNGCRPAFGPFRWYHSPAMSETTTTTALQDRIKNLIVRRLKLEVDPASIESTAPIFGGGLGLDSIDALELVLGIEQEFGVRIDDEEIGSSALASVESLASFLAERGVAG